MWVTETPFQKSQDQKVFKLSIKQKHNTNLDSYHKNIIKIICLFEFKMTDFKTS